MMILKTTYKDPSITNAEALADYLNSISGRGLAITCIRNNIFKTKWSSKDDDLMNRCHLKAAALYLTHLITEGKSNDNSGSIRTTIADLAPCVEQLDQNEDCSFIILSPNTLSSSIHYKHAEWLFYKNRLPEDSNERYTLDVLVLYALRLSLEKRILGILGIDYLIYKNKPVGLSRLIPILERLENVQYDSRIIWLEIKVVNDWLNHFMHRHIRPYPWVIHQVFEVLNPILLPGQLIEGNTKHFSLYASTFVKDEDNLHSEIEEKINSLLPSHEIRWLNKREILLAKSNE
jgi:hypothetical protein